MRTETVLEHARDHDDLETLDTAKLTRFLAKRIGQRIKYALLEEVKEGRQVFGPDYPILWHEATLEALRPTSTKPVKPAMQVQTVYHLSIGRIPQSSMVPFDTLYDVADVEPEIAPEPEPEEPPAPRNEQYTCPHCGELLRVSVWIESGASDG